MYYVYRILMTAVDRWVGTHAETKGIGERGFYFSGCRAQSVVGSQQSRIGVGLYAQIASPSYWNSLAFTPIKGAAEAFPRPHEDSVAAIQVPVAEPE